MNEFMNNLKAIFITKLRADNSKDEESRETSELFIIAKHGLAAASRLNNTKEIEDYIEFFQKNLSVLTIN
jgi:hypothetical protein